MSTPATPPGGDATAGPISQSVPSDHPAVLSAKSSSRWTSTPSGSRHTPRVHASPAVHGSRSSHAPPSLAGAASQEPSAGLHAPTVHTSSKRVQSGGVPSPQRAELQVVSSMHGSPSSHGRASLIAAAVHTNVRVSQTPSAHGPSSSVQSSSLRHDFAVHVPRMQ